MDKILKYRNEIYGFLAIWILVFHIERIVGLPIYIPIISQFIPKGNSGVDVFMFLSGFCLCLSLKRDFKLKRFYKNRFRRLLVSYLIIATPFFLWKSIEEFSTMRILHFFYDLSGLSFWLNGCHNVWFVQAILFFYIITPLLFIVVRKNIYYAISLLFLIYVGVIIGHYFVPRYSYSAIAWSRLPIYLIGIILANYKPHIDVNNHKLWAFVFLIIGSLSLLIIFPYLSDFPPIYNWLLFGIFVFPVLFVIEAFVVLVPGRVKKVFSSFGLISLEIYICHILILHIIRFYKLEEDLTYWLYFILPVLAIPLSFIVYNFSNWLLNIKSR